MDRSPTIARENSSSLAKSFQSAAVWLSPIKVGLIIFFLVLVRNIWLYWRYSYSFLPDSNLLVALGEGFFKTWTLSSIYTFPYPLLNALTRSYADLGFLMGVQLLLGALVGGLLVFFIARKDRVSALIIGFFLIADLVWGSLTRAVMTDGIFATLNLLGLGLLLFQYDRRTMLPNWELILAGFAYGLILAIRPSNIFLAVLFPPLYFWLTRSWKKVIFLVTGFVIFFTLTGLINLKGTGRFFILDSGKSYTDQFLATPMFVYRLFSPANGQASQKLDQVLQSCYPGLDYSTAVDRSASGAFDSVNNMNFITNKVLPCVQAHQDGSNDLNGVIRASYLESFTAHPGQFSLVMIQEVGTFLRYANPYILRWELDPSKNYGCSDFSWCNQIRVSRGTWDYHLPAVSLYEKVATKVLQVYLVPMGIFTRLLPGNDVVPYLLSWVLIAILTVLMARGRMRFLALSATGLILYTAAVVVAGLGFTERYAAMLSSVQAVYSAIFWIVLVRWIVNAFNWSPFKRLLSPEEPTI